MIKLIIAFTVILAASSAQAQSRRSLKDIDKELKQTKSTAAAMALIKSIADTPPQTNEEVRVLGQLMDKYPTQGQKAFGKIKDPKLASAIQTECARQVEKYKADKDKDWSKLPQAERTAKLGAYFASQAMIAKLGNLKNRDSLPFLKQYITPEYDGVLSYEASKAIGQIAPDDPAVFKELWENKDVKSINYGVYHKSVLKEVAERTQDAGLSSKEKDDILARSRIELRGASDAEERALLKDIVKTHPNSKMRETAGQSLMHSMRESFGPEDKTYLRQWLANENEGSISWALVVVRDNWDAQYVPYLLNLARKSKWGGIRSEAVELLGQHNVKEALPYIKDCITKDKDSNVRGNCSVVYWKMTGEYSAEFTPEEAQQMEKYLNLPQVVEINSRRDDSDPLKKQYLAQKEALAKYKAAHQR